MVGLLGSGGVPGSGQELRGASGGAQRRSGGLAPRAGDRLEREDAGLAAAGAGAQGILYYDIM